MTPWTRQQAIEDVLEACDGAFGRTVGWHLRLVPLPRCARCKKTFPPSPPHRKYCRLALPEESVEEAQEEAPSCSIYLSRRDKHISFHHAVGLGGGVRDGRGALVKFIIGRHPGRDTDVVEIYDDDGRIVAAILPRGDGAGLRILSELIADEAAVRVYKGPPSVEAIEAVAADIGLNATTVLRKQKESGARWPVSVDITFDAKLRTKRAPS